MFRISLISWILIDDKGLSKHVWLVSGGYEPKPALLYWLPQYQLIKQSFREPTDELIVKTCI